MPSRGPRRAGPMPVWWRAAAATAAVSVAVSGVVSAQYEAFKKVRVGECPLCCPEGQVLAFQYTQGRVDELGSTSAARDVVTEPGLWKCAIPPSHLRALSASNSGSSAEHAKPRKARPRSKSPRFLGDTDGPAPPKEPAQEQQPGNREETLQQKEAEKRAEEQLQKRVEEETVKRAERETEIAEEDERGGDTKPDNGLNNDGTRVDDIHQHFKPSLDDKCFQKFGTTYDACLPFIKREICQWNPYPDGSQKGWCIQQQATSSTPTSPSAGNTSQTLIVLNPSQTSSRTLHPNPKPELLTSVRAFESTC